MLKLRKRVFNAMSIKRILFTILSLFLGIIFALVVSFLIGFHDLFLIPLPIVFIAVAIISPFFIYNSLFKSIVEKQSPYQKHPVGSRFAISIIALTISFIVSLVAALGIGAMMNFSENCGFCGVGFAFYIPIGTLILLFPTYFVITKIIKRG